MQRHSPEPELTATIVSSCVHTDSLPQPRGRWHSARAGVSSLKYPRHCTLPASSRLYSHRILVCVCFCLCLLRWPGPVVTAEFGAGVSTIGGRRRNLVALWGRARERSDGHHDRCLLQTVSFAMPPSLPSQRTADAKQHRTLHNSGMGGPRHVADTHLGTSGVGLPSSVARVQWSR